MCTVSKGGGLSLFLTTLLRTVNALTRCPGGEFLHFIVHLFMCSERWLSKILPLEHSQYVGYIQDIIFVMCKRKLFCQQITHKICLYCFDMIFVSLSNI